MQCEFCELARDCKDPAQYGGGCDIDGADDFGCSSPEDLDTIPEYDDDNGYDY